MRRLSALAAVMAWWLLSAATAGATIVHVTVDPASSSIQVGDVTTLSVKAIIDNPVGTGDGVFSYDLNLILASMSSMPVSVVGVHRPGVDDADFGGSNGSLAPSGILGIYGGFFDNSVGIGSPATLFTVDLKGVAPGQASVTPGPSVVPYGVDLLLYQSTSANVIYEAGATVTVTVPEPVGVSVYMMIACHGLFATRTLRRRTAIRR